MVLQMIKSISIECADSTFPGIIGVGYMVFIDFETSIFLWKQNKHRQANRVSRLRLYKMRVLKNYVENKALFVSRL